MNENASKRVSRCFKNVSIASSWAALRAAKLVVLQYFVPTNVGRPSIIVVKANRE